MNQIYCFGISGVRLSEAACEALFQGGLRLVRSKKRELRIVNDDVSGTVQTEFKKAHLGPTVGYLFTADIVTDKGSSTTEFIIANSDMGDNRDSKRWDRTKINLLKFADE